MEVLAAELAEEVGALHRPAHGGHGDEGAEGLAAGAERQVPGDEDPQVDHGGSARRKTATPMVHTARRLVQAAASIMPATSTS